MLHRGRNVTLADGTVVTPSMVVGESSPSQTIAVVQCTSITMLPGLSAHPNIGPLLASSTTARSDDGSVGGGGSGGASGDGGGGGGGGGGGDGNDSDSDSGVSVVVHMGPSTVVDDPLYIEFVARWPPNVTHIFMARRYTGEGA